MSSWKSWRAAQKINIERDKKRICESASHCWKPDKFSIEHTKEEWQWFHANRILPIMFYIVNYLCVCVYWKEILSNIKNNFIKSKFPHWKKSMRNVESNWISNGHAFSSIVETMAALIIKYCKNSCPSKMYCALGMPSSELKAILQIIRANRLVICLCLFSSYTSSMHKLQNRKKA